MTSFTSDSYWCAYQSAILPNQTATFFADFVDLCRPILRICLLKGKDLLFKKKYTKFILVQLLKPGINMLTLFHQHGRWSKIYPKVLSKLDPYRTDLIPICDQLSLRFYKRLFRVIKCALVGFLLNRTFQKRLYNTTV